MIGAITAAARLSATNWTHLCGTYHVPSNTDPNQRGALTLYVNGQMAAQTSPNELPAISRFGNGNTAPYFYLGGPIMVGAADLNPDGDMDATTIIPTSPVPANFFKGWIDEVRIWDGARSQSEVVSAMTKRMKQADVLSGGGNAVPMYLYSFDALPDPKHSPTAPAGLGFDVTGNSIFPATWTGVGFWATELSRSQVYAWTREAPGRN